MGQVLPFSGRAAAPASDPLDRLDVTTCTCPLIEIPACGCHMRRAGRSCDCPPAYRPCRHAAQAPAAHCAQRRTTGACDCPSLWGQEDPHVCAAAVPFPLSIEEWGELLALHRAGDYTPPPPPPGPAVALSRLARVEVMRQRHAAGLGLYHDEDSWRDPDALRVGTGSTGHHANGAQLAEQQIRAEYAPETSPPRRAA